MYRYGLLVPPDSRLPSGWRTSPHGGLPVTALPETPDQIRRDIARCRSWLTPHERTLPEYDDNNWGAWLRRFEREQNEVPAAYDGRTPPGRYNAEGRHAWWDSTGTPWPPPSRPRGSTLWRGTPPRCGCCPCGHGARRCSSSSAAAAAQ